MAIVIIGVIVTVALMWILYRILMQWQKDFIEKVYELTPNDKPLLIYNNIGSAWAFVTFEKFVDEGSSRIIIGDKVLVDKTAFIVLVGNQHRDEAIDYLLKRMLDCDLSSDQSSSTKKLWQLARDRIFRLSEDLYVQGATDRLSNNSAEIQSLNKRCYAPSQIWEVLESDILNAIQLRT